MSAYVKAKKQAHEIIDNFMAKTGTNYFNVKQFVEWLAGQPDHPAYGWCYGAGKDDSSMAFEMRCELVRRRISGLRIVVHSQPVETRHITGITVREVPAMVSPIAGRKSGGGYVSFDPSDTAMASELRQQGATFLRGWLGRYSGVFEAAGADLSGIVAIAEWAEKEENVA